MIGDESEGGDCDEVICAAAQDVNQKKSEHKEVSWHPLSFAS